MRITAVVSHTSTYPEPISFEPGDPLLVGERDTEYPGWIWVTIPSGRSGWAPQAYLRMTSRTGAFATERYTARELDTTVGQALLVHGELNEWLWVENKDGEFGWVPRKTTSIA